MATPAVPDTAGQLLWANFRRASITAVIVVLAAFAVYLVGAEPLGNLLLAGAALGWAIYLAAFVLPGVIRLLRRQRLHR